MTALKAWILVGMAVSFLAGIPAGVLLSDRVAPPAAERGPLEDYAERLGREFELDPERRRALRVILADYERELDAIRSRQLDRFEDEIVRAGRLCRDRIRNVLLRPEDRPRFDALAARFAP
jgi:hypothetical protein